MNNLRAVIFDMDGTLLDTERLALAAWRCAEAERGETFAEDFYVDLIGRATQDSQRMIAEAIGDTARFEAFQGAWNMHYLRLAENDGWPLRPGALEVVAEFKAAGLALSVATSTRREWAVKKLASVGLLEAFDSVTTGDEVERSKPAPDIFHLAVERTGLPAEVCLVVEDSPNGVRAAHAAGLRTVLIPDLAPIEASVRALAWREMTSLHELRKSLGSHFMTI